MINSELFSAFFVQRCILYININTFITNISRRSKIKKKKTKNKMCVPIYDNDCIVSKNKNITVLSKISEHVVS